jgi:signal transduction histidine kinase
MGDGMPSIARRYGAAVIAVALVFLLTLACPPVRSESPTALFFAAVMISSWYAGLGPGLLATALSVCLIDYLIMPPAFNIVLRPGDVVRIAVFVLVALLISSLNLARRRLEADHRRKTDELIEADRHKDEFLAVLAHELRNPLATITNVLHLMREEQGLRDPEAAAVIGRKVSHMARLIDDLLDAARVARGVITLRKEDVDLATAVAHAVGAVRPMIEEREQALSVSVPPEPMQLEADLTRLEQILVNLLSNASRYTDPGGSIWLVAERDGDELRLTVRDTGVGIPSEMLPQIFGLFVQADRDRSRIRGGLGIGLALVRSLVELHGGTIEARSEGPGQGSEFIARLPAKPRQTRDEESPGVPALLFPRGRLLFVEDRGGAAHGLECPSPQGGTRDLMGDERPAAPSLGHVAAESSGQGV